MLRFADSHCKRSIIFSTGVRLSLYFDDHFSTGPSKLGTKFFKELHLRSADQSGCGLLTWLSTNGVKTPLLLKLPCFNSVGLGQFRWELFRHRMRNGTQCVLHSSLLLLWNDYFIAFVWYRRVRLCQCALVQVSA